MDVKEPPRTAYRFGRFRLDITRGVLLAPDGAEVHLRPKSFAMLQLFVENAGRLLDRKTIIHAVWRNLNVTDESITQCVRDIRRALGQESRALLRTMQRRGYKFDAEVTLEEGSTATVFQSAEGTSAPQATDRNEPPAVAPGVATPHAVERRQVTLLRCSLAGSTALAACLNPEDLRAVLQAYHQAAGGAVEAQGGHVAKFLADGMLVCFGWPQAHEDDAERAVRAGIAMTKAMPHLATLRGGPLAGRVGIATGLVVVGAVPGKDGAGELGVVGEAPGLAARLADLARPGAVVADAATRGLTGALFVWADLGEVALNGAPRPVRAWQAQGPSDVESRFEALRGATTRLPLVGRGEELDLLLRRWRRARAGEGQVVLLRGEPGIGKSRLTAALQEALAGEVREDLVLYCTAQHTGSPLHPVIARLERVARFAPGDAPEICLAKLEAMLTPVDPPAEDVALIADLLSVPSLGRWPALDLSPQARRARLHSALLRRVRAQAVRRPVLAVVEDAQWIDPTSRELLDMLVAETARIALLLVIAHRPEFNADNWLGEPHITPLHLNRLGPAESRVMLRLVAGEKALPASVEAEVLARSNGVPLFVEEVGRAVLESGAVREETDGWVLDGAVPYSAVPATLHASLTARLDRLSPAAREVAQAAAVVGRDPSPTLLAAVIETLDTPSLDAALQELIGSGLMVRRASDTPDAVYGFKHALVQDAAYSALLRPHRRELHARVAEVLEKRFAQAVEAEPDVLAFHWAAAGEVDKAVACRLKAAERALIRSATAEALGQLTVGKQLLLGLPDDDARRYRELDLQIALGAALSATKGQAALETAQAYGRARELCGELGEERRLVPVLLGLWASHNARDELDAARAVAAELLQFAERKEDEAASILGHRALGATLFGLGEFTAAREHLQRLLALDCEAARHSPGPLPYDPCVSGRSWLALTLSVLGYPEQAIEQANKALVEAQQLGHQNTLSLALCLRCSVGQFLGDHSDVAKHAECLLTIAAERGFAYWEGFGRYFRGWAQAEAGETTTGIEEMRRALIACETTGAQAYVPYNLALLADVCRRVSDAHQGRELLNTALHRLGRTDARYCEAELFRIDGELRLAESPPDREASEASFERATEISRRQHAKLVELRAATSLALLWVEAGKRCRARELLASVYGWFTEGFATKHLVEAKRLIDTLA